MSRSFALTGLAFAVTGASCALTFPDYELEDGSTSHGAGGAGGAATQSASSSSSGPSPNGAACSSPDECNSGHCVPNNTGEGSVCCASECPNLGVGECDTNGNCDAQGESCALYEAGTPCGSTSTCEDVGQLTSMQCQMGSCEHVLGPCPGNFVCEDADECLKECITEADCAHPDATCIASKCVQPAGAPCTANDQCESLLCGTMGMGHCCAAECEIVGSPCGATDCKAADGTCDYPETACGPTHTCEDAILESEYCDGLGTCEDGLVEKPCPGFLVCDDALSCLTTCGSNDSTGDALCTQGHWCDGSTCRFKGGFLAPCSRSAQCASGICTAWGCW